MFTGGLNGDGFFNEEYDGGGYENGEGCNFGYSPAVDIDKLYLTKTGIESDKAVQFMYKDWGVLWMPKSALSKPHLEQVEAWAITMLNKNIKKLIKELQDKNNENNKL